jgi:(2Fe-2S) ferredoxin
MTEFEPQARWRVHLCHGPNCTERGSRRLMPVLTDAVRRAGLEGEVEIIASTCRNRCDFGPAMNVYPGPVFYNGLSDDLVERIVTEHLVNGQVLRDLTLQPPVSSGDRSRPRKRDGRDW